MRLSTKLRKWAHQDQEGLIYWCQGCESAHQIRTKGPTAWGWNGDVEKPVFTPSVLVTGVAFTPKGKADYDAWADAGFPGRMGQVFENAPLTCHTFVGCNGAQPGEVIFLGDCTHALADQVLPFPDLPGHMQ